ncbi:MAG: J domain-containing protein [Cyanothece sp. SIO2G6]|nr:J domain-containing protein [Cyanothece sp. SIO2G6]
MMVKTHYDTLELHPSASQAEIKQAYRRLAKLFHPDSHHVTASHDRITSLNAAYEILGDPSKRQHYDAQIQAYSAASSTAYTSAYGSDSPRAASERGRERPSERRRPTTGQTIDAQIQAWLQQVYTPVSHGLGQVINQLTDELRHLSADPFDDELLEDFQQYLDDCRGELEQAQSHLQSLPNPRTLAGVASSLYHCLNQVSDGVDELERFISCYDEHYLHTGQELFRIAHKLRTEARIALAQVH